MADHPVLPARGPSPEPSDPETTAETSLRGVVPLAGGRTVENLIVDELRESILDGTLAPGARLPIREVADRLEVSVTPVRIALKQLAGEGLVELTPHAGATVAPLTVDELEELLATRDGIESWLAFTGAPLLTDAAIAEMTSILDVLAGATAAGDQPRFVEASWALRTPCYLAAGRERLYARAADLFRRSRRYHLLNLAEQERLAWSHDLFERFAAACAARDGAGARDLMREGLEWTLGYLVEVTQATGA